MSNPNEARLFTRHKSHSAPDLFEYAFKRYNSHSSETGTEAYSCRTIIVNPRDRHDLLRNNLPSKLTAEHLAPFQSSVDSHPKQKQDNESLNYVLWSNPTDKVKFRDWYISNFCNLSNVLALSRIQTLWRPLKPFATFYFRLLSITGEAEFYVISIPTLIWVGVPQRALEVASMLCVTQYLTGTLKDLCCCPRPPCPPLSMLGRLKTHSTEYGFPSTHSSNSVIFSYFIYRELHHYIPRLRFLWLFIAIFFSINVSYSRLYLGMHWIGDVIGGWIIAVLCVLNHALYLNYLEFKLVNINTPPWWCYILVYVVIHILVVIHPTPHDPCPCYLDSLRFLGVTLGALYGFWVFKSVYGTLTARKLSGSIFDVMMSYGFWLEWVACIVMVVIAKELAALLGIIVLKRIFKFMSGVYAGAFPPRVRRIYLIFVRFVGYTTRGRARGPCLSTPRNPTAMNTTNKSQTEQAHADAATSGEVRQDRDGDNGHTPVSSHSNEPTTVSVAINTMDHHQQDGENVERQTKAERPSMNEDEGYFNEYQVWSLRTHKHWWLWEAHKCTFSYAVMGFVVVFISQVFLLKVFKSN